MVMERWRPGRGLIPWRPFRELEEMERRFEDIFGRPFLPSVRRRLPIEERGWAPPIEVFEKEDKFVVKAELPGMKEEDIGVSVVGDTLTVKGERKTETEVKEEDYYCCERSYGSFFRSIALPSTVDAAFPKPPRLNPRKSQSRLKRRRKPVSSLWSLYCPASQVT